MEYKNCDTKNRVHKIALSGITLNLIKVIVIGLAFVFNVQEKVPHHLKLEHNEWIRGKKISFKNNLNFS
jgi:hypothetical protein